MSWLVVRPGRSAVNVPYQEQRLEQRHLSATNVPGSPSPAAALRVAVPCLMALVKQYADPARSTAVKTRCNADETLGRVPTGSDLDRLVHRDRLHHSRSSLACVGLGW